ncbi:hypothetical protein [Actinacidiphila paucisporea]|uniref:Nitroreductase family protein n=1 Tax=Actinacidiphila paucisporea TaxID=310782 RepID=A0A1M7FRM1_9ACTN|nr:hypothetical protein [Actinacidiphila paucisporea]SHM06772.1 hypothetical protein SAMN05216499_10839 [Actinacidiphila paucisporea]
MTDPVRTALAAAHAHGPGKSLGPVGGAVRVGRPRPTRSVPLSHLADDPSFGAALAGTLSVALAPRRWEPWNPHNDHRGYPSPRCVYPTDAALRLGGERWPVDPVRLVLEGERPLPDPAAVGSATVELTVAPHRLPDGYGTLRDALALLEAGHVTSCLIEAGRTAGLVGHASSRGGGGRSGVVAEVTFEEGEVADRPWRQAVAERSGALAPRGLSADPRPLPAGTLGRVVRDSRPPAGSLAGRRGAVRLRHRLAVRGIVGVRDGLYELGEGGPDLIRPGRATEWIGPAFGFGRAAVDVPGMNVVWAISGDVEGAVREQGPDAYRDMLLAAGAAAQHVCSAAAVSGLFCRPVRSFDEPAAEAAMRADPGEDIVYMLLIGRPRALDFCYDLTDPGEFP